MKAIKAMFAINLTVLGLGSTNVFAGGILGDAVEEPCRNCYEPDEPHKPICATKRTLFL